MDRPSPGIAPVASSGSSAEARFAGGRNVLKAYFPEP